MNEMTLEEATKIRKIFVEKYLKDGYVSTIPYKRHYMVEIDAVASDGRRWRRDVYAKDDGQAIAMAYKAINESTGSGNSVFVQEIK